MDKKLRPVGITGVGAWVPERVLTNSDLEKMVDTSDEWIVTRTGIRERRIADPEWATSDLATRAAEQALARAGVAAGEVELIVVATVTPDYVFPATASLVQKNLGASRAAAFDLSAGCTGFVYALVTAAQFVAAGTYGTALVIGAETMSRIVDYRDRRTCVLFGDGAGAAVLQPVGEGKGLLSSYLASDGNARDLMILPAGGSRHPASHETVEGRKHYLQLCGREVFKLAVREMPRAVEKALLLGGLGPEEIDLLVPHQANLRIIDAAVRRFELPPERVMVNVDRYGNMSSASIPVALEEAVREGKIRDGDLVAMVAFGAGATWGAAVVRWGT